MNIHLELLIAAYLLQEGEMFIGDEFIVKTDYVGKAIAIEPDHLRSGWRLTLVEEKDIEYDEDDE